MLDFRLKKNGIFTVSALILVLKIPDATG